MGRYTARHIRHGFEMPSANALLLEHLGQKRAVVNGSAQIGKKPVLFGRGPGQASVRVVIPVGAQAADAAVVVVVFLVEQVFQKSRKRKTLHDDRVENDGVDH